MSDIEDSKVIARRWLELISEHRIEDICESLLDLLTDGRVMFGLGHGSPADMEHTGFSQEENIKCFVSNF